MHPYTSMSDAKAEMVVDVEVAKWRRTVVAGDEGEGEEEAVDPLA